MSSQEVKAVAKQLKAQASILGGFVATFWIVEIIDRLFFRDKLSYFGIIPHRLIGLRGVLFAPFLHGGWGHLIANTIPFIVLGWFVMLQETSDFFLVTAMTMLVGGLGVWLFGASGSIHIGASILIFGYLGFLLLRGYFQRDFPSIFLSIIVGFLYGGLIWGVLPSQQGISWEGHLFGFIGGVLAARMIGKRRRSS
ncbi:MAG: rhomboid family intramembrane serine protease [Moorea sp. SIO2B7]|nr:rhomboid family intramembrane serine protease [Moorena sp. SIO2B7]